MCHYSLLITKASFKSPLNLLRLQKKHPNQIKPTNKKTLQSFIFLMKRRPLGQDSHTLSEMKLIWFSLQGFTLVARELGQNSAMWKTPSHILILLPAWGDRNHTCKQIWEQICVQIIWTFINFWGAPLFRFKLTTEAQLAYQLGLIKDFQLI